MFNSPLNKDVKYGCLCGEFQGMRKQNFNLWLL